MATGETLREDLALALGMVGAACEVLEALPVVSDDVPEDALVIRDYVTIHVARDLRGACDRIGAVLDRMPGGREPGAGGGGSK